jgi:hypothetical protein
VHDDGSTGIGEPEGDGPADPGGRAGHQGGTATQGGVEEHHRTSFLG